MQIAFGPIQIFTTECEFLEYQIGDMNSYLKQSPIKRNVNFQTYSGCLGPRSCEWICQNGMSWKQHSSNKTVYENCYNNIV